MSSLCALVVIAIVVVVVVVDDVVVISFTFSPAIRTPQCSRTMIDVVPIHRVLPLQRVDRLALQKSEHFL